MLCLGDAVGLLGSCKCCILLWATLVLWEADVPLEMEVQKIYRR